MTPQEPDTIEKLLEDAYQIGRTDALLDTNDHDTLMPRLVEKAKAHYAAKLKEAELRGRIAELENAKACYQRTYKQTITDNVGSVYLDDSHGYISSYEVRERIATLQQELAALEQQKEDI